MTDTRPTTTDEPAIADDDLTLGSVVQSNTQMDYTVEVYRDHEKERTPAKEDYEFGQPVYATTTVRGEERALVGVIYDSRLVDPAQSRDGPRLSTPDQELFVPGYVDEKRTLLGVAFLGSAALTPADGGPGDSGTGDDFAGVSQGMPRWTLDIDDSVRKLSSSGFEQFHWFDGGLRLRYYDRLIATADQFGAEVTLSLIDRLRDGTSEGKTLDVIEQKVRWEASSDRGVVR